MDGLKPTPPNSSPLTPIGFLDRAATIYGSCPSIVYKDMVRTWSQTHQRCIKLASTISSMGIGRGDVVSVVAPNIPAVYEMHFAVPMCGAILNTVNIRLASRTIAALLLHSEAKIVFVDFQSWSLVKDAVGKLEKPPRLILIEDEFEEGGRCLPSSSPPSHDDQLTYEMLVEKGNPGFRWVRPESEWSPAILNYTSGTTSSPKGVVHCHRGLFTMAVSALIEWTVPKQLIYLWTLPMFHANGWSFPWGIAAMGGTNVFVRKFDAATIYAMIIKHGVTHMCAAPVVLNMLANAPESIRRPLPHAVHIMTAGAPPPASVLFRTEALGFTVSHVYGLTETVGPVLSCAWKAEWDQLPAADRAKLKARQGVQTLCMDEIDVIDGETGASMKRDGMTLGEIVLRGSCITLGYLKDTQATSKSLRDGWFYTGDVGVMHPDGYVEIKDRSKDVIISGGENMSSVEVESVLYSHPAVNEAAVVARPDEFWGELPCAFVSLKEDYQKEEKRPSEKEIIAFCRERLPRYMVPKMVVFRVELPKTSTGKIQKFLLRDMARKLGYASSLVSRM
ncbi:2-methylpropanoate--CoA ligase CCL4-like [Magnolia sinica]|uniref:2-methylpropanoate--CoA ligase CCL4-like n=1 Tax=Magnolia sinica TaxID=86752 RepID=UPI002659398B|nr:2-methylpropanoate--CoA ligase CCL4-like [Magnolia sinica]